MYDEEEAERLKKTLEERLGSLSELHSADLISERTLASQLLELLSTVEARRYWDLTMKKDMTARRMLTMLEDPEKWEIDSSAPQKDREDVLRRRLVDVFLQEDPQDSIVVLEQLLDTASLPHFESAVFSQEGKQSARKSGARLSVLD